MNLKDRLDNIKNTNVISIKEGIDTDSFVDIKNIFVNSDDVKNILDYVLLKKNNIAFVADKSIDRVLLSNYVKSLLYNYDIEIFNSLDQNIVDFYSKIKLFPNPSINDVVKIFEYIIYGYNSFIFSLEMSYDENFIDKLRAVIAVNFKNLTEENINTLIGCSDLYVLPINRNEDGLFIVSEVIKLNYFEKKINLEVIKKICDEIPSEGSSLTENVSNAIVEVEINKENQNLSQQQESITSESEDIQDESSGDIVIQNNEVMNKVKNEYSENLIEQEEIPEKNEVTNISNVSNVPIEINEINKEENDNTDINLSDVKTLNSEENASNNNSELDSSDADKFSLKKVNKYKLLREKIRSKRNE